MRVGPDKGWRLEDLGLVPGTALCGPQDRQDEKNHKIATSKGVGGHETASTVCAKKRTFNIDKQALLAA